MKKFEMPEIKIIRFSTENIATLSGEFQTIEDQAQNLLKGPDGQTSVAAIFEFTI